MNIFVGNNRCWLKFKYAVIVLFCVSAAFGRSLPVDFDLEAEAAEPRPIVIETGPSAEALPLVFLDEPSAGPLTQASEQVEKVLSPALSFEYTSNQVQSQLEIFFKHHVTIF